MVSMSRLNADPLLCSPCIFLAHVMPACVRRRSWRDVQELTLWAEAFQRQQALGHELHRAAEAPGGVAGADEFRAPPMERLRAAAAARQALDAAMRRGDAPDGSEECVRLRQAAEPTVHPGDVAIPAAAAVRIQVRARPLHACTSPARVFRAAAQGASEGAAVER